jgi:type II secretory pathway pseudopilin PulG
MKKRKQGIKPQSIVVIVLVIVVLGISLVYAVYQSSLNKEKQTKIEELQKKVNSLTDSIESLQSSGSQAQAAAQGQEQLQSVVGPWPEYTNEIIGFNLTFPETWKEYLLTEGNGFVDFGFVEQNPVARINVIGHEQWEQIRQQENNGLAYVGETEAFVIVYSLVTEAVSEEIQPLILEFPEIISTLTLLEGELIVADYSSDVLAEDEDIDAEEDGDEDIDAEEDGDEDIDAEEEIPEEDPSLE